MNNARNLFGDGNTLTTQLDYSNLTTNFGGSGNTVTSTGGYFNGARNIVGNGNALSVGSRGSNLNLGLNLFGINNQLKTAIN